MRPDLLFVSGRRSSASQFRQRRPSVCFLFSVCCTICHPSVVIFSGRRSASPGCVMRSGRRAFCRRSWWRSVALSGALRRSVCVCALVALCGVYLAFLGVLWCGLSFRCGAACNGAVWRCRTFPAVICINTIKRPSRLFAFPDGVLCGFSVWSIVLLLVAVYAVLRGFLYSSIKAALTASMARRSSAYIHPSSSPV